MSVLSSVEDGDELVTISRQRYEDLLLIEFCQTLEHSSYLHIRSAEENTSAKNHFAAYLSSQSLGEDYYGGTLEKVKAESRKRQRTEWHIPKAMIHQPSKGKTLSRAALPEQDD